MVTSKPRYKYMEYSPKQRRRRSRLDKKRHRRNKDRRKILKDLNTSDSLGTIGDLFKEETKEGPVC